MGTLTPQTHPTLLAIDWGTTHRRAYVLDAQGLCVQQHADAHGSLACKGRFPEALQNLLKTLHIAPDLVVMSGMVGSAFGWQEAPYATEAVALDSLQNNLVKLKDSPAGMPCVLVPGYCIRNPQGQPDVMRGEETQLLGAVALGHDSGWFCLPGTHSKWVELKAGRIQQLRTYMTGELFGLLTQHGTLAAAAGTATSAWDTLAFSEGVDAARHGGVLSHQLFGCRARVVCGDRPASSAHAYLSGLLIGSEWQDVQRRDADANAATEFKLLGSPALTNRYQDAAKQLGLHVEDVDAQAAYLAAMVHIQTHWSPS
jgi:2-dehydro-3-deoxygalactonokinase